MRLIFIITATIIALGGSSQSAIAQKFKVSPVITKSYADTPYYNKMVRNALKNKPARFDFMKLRILYARTRQYDPIGEAALKTINDFAYIVLHDEDPERAAGALFAYQAEVAKHLAHIDVVLLALSLAREDKRFGRPEFFEWMRDGLIKTVVISGDGYTLNGAYDVITLSEEVILFNRINFQKNETIPVREGIIHYNMHDGEDVQSGRKRTVFVNTSIPMKHLELLQLEQKKTFTLDIGKQ